MLVIAVSILLALASGTSTSSVVEDPAVTTKLFVEREPAKRQVKVRGRLVDESGAPIASRLVDVAMITMCEWGWSAWQYSDRTITRTDAEGRISLSTPPEGRDYCRWTVELELRRQNLLPGERERSALVSLLARIHDPVHELGDICLAAETSARRCERLSDDDLEFVIESEVRDLDFPARWHWIESFVAECTRRGGARFDAVQESLIASLIGPPHRLREELDLMLLTMRRRLQLQRDPLRLLVRDATPIVSEYPVLPTLRMKLVNVDVGGAAPTISIEPDERSICSERWSVEVRKPDGTVLEPLPLSGGCFVYLLRFDKLGRGQSLEADLPLAEYVQGTMPGKYEARVRYNVDGAPGRYPRADKSLDPMSKWIPFEVRGRTVRIPRALDRRLGELVASVTDPAYILAYPDKFHPAREFRGTPRTVEEQLHAAGFQSLRVLFEALDDPAITPRKRAWILNELHLLTGQHELSGFALFERRLGSEHSIQVAGNGPVWENPNAKSFLPIDEAKQREFAAWWNIGRQGIRFEIVD